MKSILSAALLLLAAAPAQAAELYKCGMNVTANNRVISDKIFIHHDRKTGQAFVMDAFVKNYVNDPVPARVLADNGKRITFGWTLKDIKPTSGRVLTRVEFKLSYLKATKEAHAVSSVPLYDFSESGFGSCIVEVSKG